MEEEGHGPTYWVTTIIAEMVLGILAIIIVLWFSRYREFRADAGGARLAGREKIIAALECLRLSLDQPHLPDQLAAIGISAGSQEGLDQAGHTPWSLLIVNLGGCMLLITTAYLLAWFKENPWKSGLPKAIELQSVS
jgi:hypothetical protein